MIKFPDAVSNPGTVVIHSQNTSFANRAMMHSLLLDDVTLEAKEDNGEGIDFLSE